MQFTLHQESKSHKKFFLIYPSSLTQCPGSSLYTTGPEGEGRVRDMGEKQEMQEETSDWGGQAGRSHSIQKKSSKRFLS